MVSKQHYKNQSRVLAYEDQKLDKKIYDLEKQKSEICSVDGCNKRPVAIKIEKFTGDRSEQTLFTITYYFCKEHNYTDRERVTGSNCHIEDMDDEND